MKYQPLALGLLTALAIASSGCEKFLDQAPLGQYEAGSFLTSDANAQLAINAAYAPLSFHSAADHPLWVMGDIGSDDVAVGGNAGDNPDFTNIDIFNVTPGNKAVGALWSNYYGGIFKANYVIDGLSNSNSNVSEAVRNQAVGQAKFLRAWYYFQLTSLYGRIPLHLKVETPDELLSPARSQADVYAQVETDCRDALALLPNTWTGADQGRATKGAALALLAKTYLFEKKWADAAQAAQAVTALNVYRLLPVYADNFRVAPKKTNTEAIFSALHTTGLTPAQGSGLNQWFAPLSQNGYAFYNPTKNLVLSYDTTASGIADPRLDYSIARPGHSYFGVAFDPDWSTTGYLSKKHVQPLTEVSISTKGDGGLDYVAIRYADVLLMQAEALNESGNSSGALAPLNAVRKRARESFLNDPSLPGAGTVPAGLLADITITDQNMLRDIIRHERRVELALEFQRFPDVIRYGQAYAQQALGSNFNYTQNMFYPIPQRERDTNKNLGL